VCFAPKASTFLLKDIAFGSEPLYFASRAFTFPLKYIILVSEPLRFAPKASPFLLEGITLVSEHMISGTGATPCIALDRALTPRQILHEPSQNLLLMPTKIPAVEPEMLSSWNPTVNVGYVSELRSWQSE
jgi:hypothetical protein